MSNIISANQIYENELIGATLLQQINCQSNWKWLYNTLPTKSLPTSVRQYTRQLKSFHNDFFYNWRPFNEITTWRKKNQFLIGEIMFVVIQRFYSNFVRVKHSKWQNEIISLFRRLLSLRCGLRATTMSCNFLLTRRGEIEIEREREKIERWKSKRLFESVITILCFRAHSMLRVHILLAETTVDCTKKTITSAWYALYLSLCLYLWFACQCI